MKPPTLLWWWLAIATLFSAITVESQMANFIWKGILVGACCGATIAFIRQGMTMLIVFAFDTLSHGLKKKRVTQVTLDNKSE